jgi:hypothetical protein
VIPILVRDVTALGVLRDDDLGDTSTVTKEVDRLNITRVIVSATLVERNEDSSVSPKGRVCLDLVDDFFDKPSKRSSLEDAG